jgi:hypothetical protein
VETDSKEVSMPEPSILKSIKKLLGIADDYDVFDPELIILINTQFSVLHNIGAAPPDGFFTVTSDAEKWEDYIGDIKQAEMVKTYIYLKVRMLFDPPATSFVLAAFQEQAKELEWRLNTMEFDFNPAARPIVTDRDNRILLQLQGQLDDLEEKVDQLDDEVNEDGEPIPDLTTIFQDNLDD